MVNGFRQSMRSSNAFSLRSALFLSLMMMVFAYSAVYAQDENIVSLEQLAAGCRGVGRLARLSNGNWYCCTYPIRAGTDCALATGIVGGPNTPVAKRKQERPKSVVQRLQKPQMATSSSPRKSLENSTAICIRPIFEQEMKLRALIDGSPKKTKEIAEAIVYLRSEFCRSTDEQLTTDKDVFVEGSDNCHQYTGLLRGERVYWGECPE